MSLASEIAGVVLTVGKIVYDLIQKKLALDSEIQRLSPIVSTIIGIVQKLPSDKTEVYFNALNLMKQALEMLQQTLLSINTDRKGNIFRRGKNFVLAGSTREGLVWQREKLLDLINILNLGLSTDLVLAKNESQSEFQASTFLKKSEARQFWIKHVGNSAFSVTVNRLRAALKFECKITDEDFLEELLSVASEQGSSDSERTVNVYMFAMLTEERDLSGALTFQYNKFKNPTMDQSTLEELTNNLTLQASAPERPQEDALSSSSPSSSNLKPNESPMSDTAAEDMDQYYYRIADRMRGEGGVEIKDSCFVGSEAVDWVQKTLKNERSQALQLLRQLFRKKIIYHVANTEQFEDKKYFYRFLEDDIVDKDLNKKKFFEPNDRVNSIAVAEELLLQIVEIYKSNGLFLSPIDLQQLDSLRETIRSSEKFRLFELASCQLSICKPEKLNEEERTAFFLNVANTLAMHSHIICKKTPLSGWKYLSFMGGYRYDVGGLFYCYCDIMHGVLRGNQVDPFKFTKKKMFAPINDSRVGNSLTRCNPLIHFGLTYGTISSPRLMLFKPTTLKQQLREAVRFFLEDHVTFSDKKLKVPKIFSWFEKDFLAEFPSCETKMELIKFFAKEFLPDSELKDSILIKTWSLVIEDHEYGFEYRLETSQK